MADAKPEKGDGEEEALQVRMRACTRGAGAARRSSFLLAVARGGGHTLTRDARVPCRPRLSRRSSGTSRRCVSSLEWARGCRAAHARRVPVRPTADAVTDATAFFFFVTGWSPRARQARTSPSGAGGAGGWRPPPRAPNRRCAGCQAPWWRWEARDPYELRELGWGMRRASRVRACTLPFGRQKEKNAERV